MSDSETPRLAMPLLAPGQAQKEMTHNEALARLDLLVGARVLSADLSAPPGAAEFGQSWIVAAGASGAWAGESDSLAGWTAGGWRFVAPPAGLVVWVEDRGHAARFDGSAWRFGEITGESLVLGGSAILGAVLPTIPPPAGGEIIDVEARAAVVLLISALQHHGLSL